MSKIRIAIIKFGGLSVGGSERFLQVVAANLSRDLFDIDYYYCDAAPYLGSSRQHGDTNPDRLKYMQNHGVSLIKFHVTFRDLTKPTFDWVGTDFWDLFNEYSYDLAFTITCGHPEYPFTLLKIPVVESIVLSGGINSRSAFHVHPSQYMRKLWFKMGGDLQKSCVVPLAPTPPNTNLNMRSELKIPLNGVVAGFHQRADDAIFSPIPLQAFSRCFAPNRYFILLGGGQKYRDQAKELCLRNVHFLPQTGDPILVSQFLNTLDIFAHGRADGETYGTVFAEAMLHGKPCLSHAVSRGDNAQPETIGPAGWFAASPEDYTAKLELIYGDPLLRKALSQKSVSHAQEYYSLESCLEELTRLFQRICGHPEISPAKKRIPYGISPLGFLYAGHLDRPDQVAHHVLTGDIPEEFYVQVVKFFLPKVRTFIDIGTNTGLYGFVAANNCPAETKIHCFEQRSESCQILSKTIDLNNWEQKVFVHPIELDTPLDHHIRNFGISNIDFIRIDANGFEKKVLEGAKEVIKKHKPILSIKFDRNSQYTEAILWLQSKGYAVYRCAEQRSHWFHFGTISKVTNSQDPEKISMFLCIPSEQEQHIFAQLKQHLKGVNKNLKKNRILSDHQKLVRMLKEKLKNTRFYPFFYLVRNIMARALKKLPTFKSRSP